MTVSSGLVKLSTTVQDLSNCPWPGIRELTIQPAVGYPVCAQLQQSLFCLLRPGFLFAGTGTVSRLPLLWATGLACREEDRKAKCQWVTSILKVTGGNLGLSGGCCCNIICFYDLRECVMIMSVLGTPKHSCAVTLTLAIKLYWCPLMKGLRWTSSTPCTLYKTGQFNLYKHSGCQLLCTPWWHYGCTTSVTLQMYCPLWQYRYTNLSDITDVQTSVTVRMYWLWHDSPIQMYLPQCHYRHADLTNWLQWQMYSPQWHGCTDPNHTMDVLYWPQHYNIMDVLTSQHHGCIDLNNILHVLTSTTLWMYWLQHSGCTDLIDIFTDLD